MLGVIGVDKILHFAVCLILSATLTATMPEISGVGITMSIGIGKELYDMNQPGNYFSWSDITADTLGVYIGTKLRENEKNQMMEKANIEFAKEN